MNDEIKLYSVEVNANFCFYVDVECADIEEAKRIAYERAYEKAEELAGDGCDEDVTYGFAEPEIGTVTNEDGEEIDEDEDEDEDEEITDEPSIRSIEVFNKFAEQITLTKGV